MPIYSYLAFDKNNNKKIEGEIESSSSANLRGELQEKGLFVIRIEEKIQAKSGPRFKLDRKSVV